MTSTDKSEFGTANPNGWVLWGFHPVHMPVPIKLTGGTPAHLRSETVYRERLGWTCAVYRGGVAPVGLRLQADG
jgi:hypothetical protein